MPVRTACDYARQAALGLQHAHEKGIIHRDIKPSNVLVAKPDAAYPLGVVKILDMGLARSQTAAGEETTSATVTQTGCVVGTPDYIAPEQARSSRQTDARSDIYSLGCTLYFLLTGQVPFPEGTVTEKLLHHVMDEPRSLEKVRPEIPPELAAVVRKMMAKRPEDRYQTATQVATALESWPNARRGKRPVELLLRPMRRAVGGRDWRWLLAGGVALAALVVTSLLFLRSGTPASGPSQAEAVRTSPVTAGPVSTPASTKLDPTGTWKWTRKSATWGTVEMTLEVGRQGDRLIGFLSTGGRRAPAVEDLVFKDGVLSFTMISQGKGGKMLCRFKGKLAGDTIRGEQTMEMDDGRTNAHRWEAKRVSK